MELRNAAVELTEDTRPAAILRGTARGLEVVVHARAEVDAIVAAVTQRLDEAPGFFKGSDVRIRVEDGPLAKGCLRRLDELADQFELRIVEVGALVAKAAPLASVPAPGALDMQAIPQPNLAAGSAPAPATAIFEDEVTNTAFRPADLTPPAAEAAGVTPPRELAKLEAVSVEQAAQLEPISFEEPTQTAAPIQLATTAEIELETLAPGPRFVIGPVRSGVILEHTGHIVVFGDVNPGAEVRATGNIIVLGRLRGTAHAGIGQEVGFILGLRLEPQQLRIGRKVARSGDGPAPNDAEIAFSTGDGIVVERYAGKLPRNLATSI
ncbi:MAG: septum site-determining protein MinC [Kofleriaceae bacterium]|nr:septum site-determining protein MinC [Kofleriaceae bacterium]